MPAPESPRSTRGLERLLVAAFCATAGAAAPETGDKPPPGVDQHAWDHRNDIRKESAGDPVRESENYIRVLDLDKAQRAKVLAVMKRLVARRQQGLDRRRALQAKSFRLMAELESIHKTVEKEGESVAEAEVKARREIRSLLKPEQQSNFDLLEAERQRIEADFNRQQREGGPGAPASPQAPDRPDTGAR